VRSLTTLQARIVDGHAAGRRLTPVGDLDLSARSGKEDILMPIVEPASPCSHPCTKIVKFMTDHDVPANGGISLPPYTPVDGYRHINVFVKFDQTDANEAPVNLGVMFAFDAGGAQGARCYANLEENVSGPQSTNFVEVSGLGTWHGSQWNTSSYVARSAQRDARRRAGDHQAGRLRPWRQPCGPQNR
jgi:hypothetical protein